jgi:hypothetical protein
MIAVELSLANPGDNAMTTLEERGQLRGHAVSLDASTGRIIDLDIRPSRDGEGIVVTSPDVPGLYLRSSNLDDLHADLIEVVPELVQANLGVGNLKAVFLSPTINLTGETDAEQAWAGAKMAVFSP